MSIPQRNPINGTFELTLRCNLHCKMCLFRHADSENAAMMAQELTCAEWEDMAKQAAQNGTINLLLTGGEPMLRSDFCQVYAGIYAHGFLLTLYTNATLVTDEVMETLRKMPPHRIGVTLYGASNADYAAVCGCADGFDRAMAGIEKLLTLPSVMDVRMTLIHDTADQADKIDQIVFERFGVHPILTSTVLGSVRGSCTKPQECRMTPQESVDLTYGRVLERIRQQVPADLMDKIHIRMADVCTDPGEPRYSLLGCSAGMTNYTITWDGKLLGCQLLGNFYTDARHDGFAAAWEAYPVTVRLPDSPCHQCEYVSKCRTCPAVAMAETGRMDGVPQYVCEVTKLTEEMKTKNNLL